MAPREARRPPAWAIATASFRRLTTSRPTIRRRFSLALAILTVLVAIVLALVCVNVGNLMLARSTARQREMSLRLALGAGRLRIVRQLLVEGGIDKAEVLAEDGQQALRSLEDWWTVVCGSGYRWTVEQMDRKTAARVREANIKTLEQNGTKSIETNVIYATASKP